MTPELIAAIIACLGALTAFLKGKSDLDKVKKDRESTRTEREAEFKLIEYRVNQLEAGHSTLITTIANLQESVNKLTVSVAELTAELRMRK